MQNIMLLKNQLQMNKIHAHVLCIQGKNWTIKEYMQMKQLIKRCLSQSCPLQCNGIFIDDALLLSVSIMIQ